MTIITVIGMEHSVKTAFLFIVYGNFTFNCIPVSFSNKIIQFMLRVRFMIIWCPMVIFRIQCGKYSYNGHLNQGLLYLEINKSMPVALPWCKTKSWKITDVYTCVCVCVCVSVWKIKTEMFKWRYSTMLSQVIFVHWRLCSDHLDLICQFLFTCIM